MPSPTGHDDAPDVAGSDEDTAEDEAAGLETTAPTWTASDFANGVATIGSLESRAREREREREGWVGKAV